MSQKNSLPSKNYRVVQWTTGNVGAHALRAIIKHPKMTLAGVFAYSEEKTGLDAGELCGIDPVGIKAIGNIDEIIDLKPDCVVYMQQGCNVDDVCKLLASGANIVTTCLKFHHPDHLDPVERQRVEEACRRGNTSIYCSGSSPGFITEVIPLALLFVMRGLDCLTINEYADMSQYPHPVMLFDIMGYGLPPDNYVEFKDHVLDNFSPSLSLVADAISKPIDAFEVNEEVATVRKKTRIVAGILEAGTIAARRITITGIRDGRPMIRFCPTWYVSTDIDASWELRESGWHVLAEGDPPFDVSIRFPIPAEQYEDVSPGYTAYGPINAIPYVCAAPSGIRTTIDLPHIVPYLG